MPFDEGKQIEQLVSIYRQGFEEILQEIVEKEAKGQWTQYWRDLLLDVESILQQLDQYADQWIEQTVGQVYSQATADTVSFLSAISRVEAARPEFAQIHQRAIDVVAQNMADNLRSATQFIGRRVNDVFRQVGVEATAGKLAAGATVRDMKREAVRRLLGQGQTAFVDRLGRKWRLDAYARMVARTTTREAASVATLNTCREFGVDLVRITVHRPTCDKCAPLQGKVFSISGNDARYPKLTDEYRPPIHPNCRHVLVSYVREFDDDAEETERFSNEPLDRDLRSEREKQQYIKEQAKPTQTAADAEIERLLRGAPLDDREKLARHLLDASDMQDVPVATANLGSTRGATAYGEVEGRIVAQQVYLSDLDARPERYRIKTVFHEFVHARANGGAISKPVRELTRDKNWVTVEETTAETVAAYMAQKAGLAGEIMPAYSDYLVETLPKLKRLREYTECRTVADFGRVLADMRFRQPPEVGHEVLMEWFKGESFDLAAYARAYKPYVDEHLEEIVDTIYEGHGGEAPRSAIKTSVVDGWKQFSKTPGFVESLAIAMNRLGVRTP